MNFFLRVSYKCFDFRALNFNFRSRIYVETLNHQISQPTPRNYKVRAERAMKLRSRLLLPIFCVLTPKRKIFCSSNKRKPKGAAIIEQFPTAHSSITAASISDTGKPRTVKTNSTMRFISNSMSKVIRTTTSSLKTHRRRF